MKTKKLFLKIFLLVFILTVLISCDNTPTYDIDFIIQNNCDAELRIEYTVRICSSIENGCSPVDYTDYADPNQSVELVTRDRIPEDGDIQNVFYEFKIFKNGIKSNFDFWDSEKLIKTKYENRLEYVLTVDSTFF